MRRLALAALIAGGLTALAPSARAEEPPEVRLERLERMLAAQAQQVEALRAELAAARSAPPAPQTQAPPPTDLVPGPAVVPAPRPSLGTDPRLSDRLLAGPRAATPAGVRWGGYVTLEYIGATNANSYFDLHRAILALDADVTDCIDVAAEFEYEHGGIGGGRTGDVEVEHFTVTWHVNDSLWVKLGAPLVPFSRFNLFHDDPLNDFTKRPWTARYMVPTGYGQPGIGLGGSCPLAGGAFTWDTLISSGFADGFTNSGGVRGSRQAWDTDNNENKQLWGRASWVQGGRRALDYLEIGASLTWARYDDAGDNDLWGFGVDVLAREGPFEFQGEYIRFDLERDALDPATAVRGQDGLWMQLAYHFMPCALRGCQSCVVRDTSHFTLAVRYQTIDLDDRRTGSHFNDDLEGWTVGLNYRLTERTVFRLDHQWLDAARAGDEREWTFSFSTYF